MTPVPSTLHTFALSLMLALGLASAPAQDGEWIEVKDAVGRSLTVKIQKVEGDDVTFSTKNGKSYTYPITKFSLRDQLTLRDWKPAASNENPVEEDSQLETVSSSDATTIFESKHFRFEVVGQAEPEILQDVAPLFEAVHWAFTKLPIPVEPKAAEDRHHVKIYLTESDFEISSQETLPAEQPALFNLSKNLLLAPLPRLEASPALVREIAFALLGEQLTTLPPWLAVALTEYLAAAPYQKDQLAFNFQDPLANMRRRLEETYRLTDKTLPMMRPTELMALGYDTLRTEGLDGYKGRSSALLAFYYFAHLDRQGKGLQDYLRAVRTQTAPDEALATLVNEREPEKLQDDIKVAYVPKGLRIIFID